MHGIYTQIHVYMNHCTICLRFVWLKQQQQQKKTKQSKYIVVNELHWLDSEFP